MVRSSFLCLAASLVFSSAVIAQDAPTEKAKPGSTAFLDSLNGFRGVTFGTDFGKFTGLTVDDEQGKVKLYKKKDDDLDIGPADLSEIVYEFYDGKFFGVILYTKDKADSAELLAIATKAFGEGQPIDPDNTVWEGKTAFAHFSENPMTGEGTFIMANSELSQKASDVEQKSIEEAVSEL